VGFFRVRRFDGVAKKKTLSGIKSDAGLGGDYSAMMGFVTDNHK
jgi:hypothetical protein